MNCYTLPIFSLLVLFLARNAAQLHVAAEAEDGTNQHESSITDDEFMGASAEIQSVNSYLTELGHLSMEPSDVAQHLEEALSMMDALGDDTLRAGVDSDTAEPHVRCLFGDDPDSLRQILSSLIQASTSCGAESIQFLSLVESQTFGGQFLHSYSRRRTNVCQSIQAQMMADRVEKSLGKVSSEIYELMADLAGAYAARDRKQSASRGQIVISDSKKSVDPREVVRTLKLIKLDTIDKQNLFATMIRNYYSNEFPTEEGERVTARRERLRNFFIDSLISPCQELTRRWSEIVVTDATIPRRKISETIEERRKNNLELDQSVEMVRICRKLQEKSATILASVEK